MVLLMDGAADGQGRASVPHAPGWCPGAGGTGTSMGAVLDPVVLTIIRTAQIGVIAL